MSKPTKNDWAESSRDDFMRFVGEFARESDRASVILGAAKLDIQLYDVLRNALKPATGNVDELLDGDSPLGTFSSRIHLAYRLGLIDDELARALHLVRRIRNSVAHEITSADLASGAHRDRIRGLVTPLRRYESFDEFKGANSAFKEHKGASADFRTAIAVIATRLERAIADSQTVYLASPVTLVPPLWTRPPSPAQKSEKGSSDS
jgi:DNA-binding MltR family transcriptional regulator